MLNLLPNNLLLESHFILLDVDLALLLILASTSSMSCACSSWALFVTLVFLATLAVILILIS
jgi:hypothetical protein